MENRSELPKNVGIVAIEVYIPKTVVSQTKLESFDDVPAGKYTIGLGQTNMGFVSDREDVNSISLTAVAGLLEKYNIDPKNVGRLEVGTETIVDKSKATKTSIMRLFQKYGNYDIEGVDSKNACYGGTAALLNSIAWVESSMWDGRYAIAVAADIAVYAEGNARPTGGCGSVAMLIGPDAPLVIERGLRGSHFEDVWDFYKPDPTSEYPTVDGKLSISCYLRALDHCYQIYRKKYAAIKGGDFTMDDADYFIFHAPYNKLVQKSFGRLLFNDFLEHPNNPKFADVAEFKGLTREETYFNRGLERSFVKKSRTAYNQKVAPSTILPKQLGNTYTASLYMGLLSHLTFCPANTVGKRLMCFSYGSGLAATLFSIRVRGPIEGIVQRAGLRDRLANRMFVNPDEFVKKLQMRHHQHNARGAYQPKGSLNNIFPGTYYLTKIDDKSRRHYARKPLLGSKI